jgi:hypothetical protein
MQEKNISLDFLHLYNPAFRNIYGTVNAQSKSRIIGTIKDAQTDEPLIGANVLVKGTYLGAASDIDGKYFVKMFRSELMICRYLWSVMLLKQLQEL